MIKEVEKVKGVIKNNIEDAIYGIFDCRNIFGDSMETIYCEADVRIDLCRDYGYFEVFGLTNKEFREVEYVDEDQETKK